MTAAAGGELTLAEAASLPVAEVLTRLSSSPAGLDAAEAARRRSVFGPNAVRTHAARPVGVLVRQLRSPLLLLLVVTAAASFLLGERTDAGIIAVILTLSVGLGFANEYRAERAAEALHDRVRHRALVLRPAGPAEVDVTALVPGDVVRLTLGSVVPADLRVLVADGLECVESVLTGESRATPKSTDPVRPHTPVAELSSCALMGTVVHAGSGAGVVVATGGRAEFGRVALALGERHPETEFQVGLRRFSAMLARIALGLSAAIFAVNVALDRPLFEALLFSLAIAVGITPQLLPAVVTTSLATGSHRLAARKVLVKRLVCIEDLGDVQVLLTDKTGTLTEGRIAFLRALAPDGTADDRPLLLGLVCSDSVVENGHRVAANPLDAALWAAPAVTGQPADGYRRVADLPFDHIRRRMTVLVDDPHGQRVLVTKGAPEGVLALCRDVPAAARDVLDAEFAAGGRVVAVATRPADGASRVDLDDERDLRLAGFLVFLDAPKPSAGSALRRLNALGISTKVLTGDAAPVAVRVCDQLGLAVHGVLTGGEVERMSDDELAESAATTTVFARVSPEDKARVVRAHRDHGHGVAFLGDGVNDAVALHAADVGVSVDTATDVAKDAADVVLLEKDLDVLGDGVVEGRRIFANTMKYVLMGTSSNFGNMASAAVASAFLPFLPMLPSQILLNNLLYDASQLAIPTDNVDAEQVNRPARWDLGRIRRYMLFFGPISSAFDLLTFAILLQVFVAGPRLFRTGWFLESLATQTLVVFVIRTRGPAFRSRPSTPLVATVLAAISAGVALSLSPLAPALGFTRPSALLGATLAAMVAAYLVVVEAVKRRFERAVPRPAPRVPRGRAERVHRRAARYSVTGRLAPAVSVTPAAPRGRRRRRRRA